MEWKSILIGFIIGALIALPYGLAHSGAFDEDERDGFWNKFGPMMGPMHGGMMGHGMMDEHEEMEEYMETGNFAEMHEEMEEEMEEYMSEDWKEMHEYCERFMGIEEDSEDE
ncbi:hypothetical protein K1720_01250 [Thermococcus argininiproducens]|uniref:Uncharacterized protein n=1 Tax=Thermococcus argininiproducens TaxID=2866384 RepID=A0A9E7MAN7_9EURY|nr:hypothetical protein [Thermococcus argininiproducens]USH00139.1 hypothetical protein K1720_01250 [Thermococcus argininiproducens]